ncbi:MAG: class IV adenylate cyclase [Candidatus Helarchaeota archaeon]|nr:class IV adenylate cyclase [Candidatus Helarchaeota archaeon]
MIEVEIKAHLEDFTSVETQLLQLGATFRKAIHQRDTYFQHPIRNFAQTDEALRIRISDDKSYLTYKGSKLDPSSKTREELELEIQEPNQLLELLKKVGFIPVKTVIKSRKSYILDDIKISLDKVEGLGYFIELEIDISEKDAIPPTRDRLISLLAQLNISSEKLERRSYLELLILQK